MMRRATLKRASLAAAVLLLLPLSGCAYHQSYWTHYRSPPPEPEVRALVITENGAQVSYPQQWRRDTLLVDLRSVSGEGMIDLAPRQGTWPMRLAFKVTPGAVGVLEIRAAQRSVLPITDSGQGPVELELDPGVYSPAKTAHIEVAWRPAPPITP
jgi:hypothetical protein